MMNISLSFPSISNIPEQKHNKDPYPQFLPPNEKQLKIREKKRKHSPGSSFQRIFFKGKVLFVRLSFSASGLRRVEHRVIQSLEPNPVLDGKLPDQLEMKMRSSWSPQKNFHHFFFCYQ
jgi:hypothetical protein